MRVLVLLDYDDDYDDNINAASQVVRYAKVLSTLP